MAPSRCKQGYTFVDFGEVVAAGHAVEHPLRIAAIRVHLGAHGRIIGNHASVLAGNWTGFLGEHVNA